MERPYSRLMHSFSIIGDLLKITFLTRGHGQRLNFKRVLDPELWCLIIIALLISTQASAQQTKCESLIVECASNITVECGDMLDPLYTGEPIINKDPDCPLVAQIGWMDHAQGNCPMVITRTWTVTDDEGNIETCDQIITVLDTLAPVFTAYPQNRTVSCDQVHEADQLEAVDNCKDNLVVDFVETSVPGNCEGEYTLTRTWTTTDDCSNSATHTQVITVIDTVAPVISGVPADITVTCNAVPAADPNVTAEDNCKNFQTVYPSDVIMPGSCANSYFIERTWWAEDGCGNIGWATQIITVIDTTAPMLSESPGDLTLECDDVPAPPVILATDDCNDEVPVSFNENLIPGNCVNSYILERTWSATDDCGNNITHIQTITVLDTVAPHIFLIGDSDDMILECSDQIPAAPVAIATDNCDENIAVQVLDTIIAGNCAQEWMIHRSWTASDACGNTTTIDQTIMVIDTVAPQFTYVPADMTIDCGTQIPFEDAEAMDNCDNSVTMMYIDDMVPGSCAGEYTILRTWMVYDDCGNTNTTVQTISIIDTIAPVFDDVLLDITVDCGSIPPVPECTATDACEGFVPAFYDGETVIPGDCPGNYTLIRSWTAFDDCGNTTTQFQTVNVIDTLPPMLSNIPTDTTVSCDAVPDPALVVASDDCDPNVGLFLEETTIEGDCEGDYTLIRKWTATDGCGNSTFAEQWITVIDTAAPVLMDVPTDITVNCDAIPDPAEVSAFDACKANIPVIFSENNNVGNCKDSYEIVRTWTAHDDCGNMVMGTQVINVVDTMAPVFDCDPQDMTVDCNTIPDPELCTATDNCDIVPTQTFSEVWTGSGCIGVYTITRTYTATDNCGNETTLTQVITVDNGPNVPTGIEGHDNSGILMTAYPNPFSEETMIRFILPDASDALLEVFDMRGRIVEVLFDGHAAANVPVAREFRPQEHGSGSYIYRLSAKNEVLYGRLVVTR